MSHVMSMLPRFCFHSITVLRLLLSKISILCYGAFLLVVIGCDMSIFTN